MHWGQLCRDLFSARALPAWPQFTQGQAIDFYQVRCALWFLCAHWNLQPDDEVLMPAYNCGSEVDPFFAYGVKVVFYPVDERARIDTDQIQGLCGPKTRVVYITHYFGWGHNIESLYIWCKGRGIKLVEDCALSLFSSGEEGDIGGHSDAALFSLKKSLPVPDGAVLVLRSPIEELGSIFKEPAASTTIKNLLPFAKSSVMAAVDGTGVNSLRKERAVSLAPVSSSTLDSSGVGNPDMPNGYYFDRAFCDWRMSRTCSGILSRTVPEEVIERRRKNFLYLQDQLRDTPQFAPLYESLPAETCPLSFPAVVPNRRGLVDALGKVGITAYPWWEGYHRSFVWSDYPEARFLKDRVIALPVHQLLDISHTEFIADSVKRFLR